MTATPDNAEAQEPGSTENSNAIALGLIGDEWNLTIIKLAIMSDVRNDDHVGESRARPFRL